MSGDAGLVGAVVGALTGVPGWLVRLTLGGLVVSAATLAVGSLVPRRHAEARVAVWRAGLVALLILPVASGFLPWRWAVPVAASWSDGAAGTATETAAVGAGARGADSERMIVANGAAGEARAGVAPAGRANSTDPDGAGILVLAWGLAGLGALAYYLAGLAALRRHARRARDVTGDVASLLPPGRRVRVLRGGPFTVPGCWGVARPTILLPAASAAWSADELRAVLLHEAAHLERRDPLFFFLGRAACALHWLNPLAWHLQRALVRDGEAACDARVVGAGVPARSYAGVLVDMASRARGARPGLMLPMARPGTLTTRVRALLDGQHAEPDGPGRRRPAGLPALVPLAVAVGCATAGAAAPDASGGDAEGTWEGRYDRGAFYVELVDGAGAGLNANHLPVHDLVGLDPARGRAGGPVAFELTRAPGTIAFRGRLDDVAGSGTYTFAADPAFLQALADRGIGVPPPDRVLLLALQGVDLAFVDDLRTLTTGPLDEDLLIRAAIFDVDRAFIRAMAAVGYPRLPVQDLVRLRIFGIDAAYARALPIDGSRVRIDQTVSRSVRIDQMVSQRIRERTAEKERREAGR